MGNNLDSYQRLLKLREYIGANLDDELSLRQLSQRAHISQYHLHRLFSANFGIPLARYIARERLRRACYQLAFRPDQTVTAIALSAGYASPEAFSRAFARIVGRPPAAFRRAPDWERWEEHFGETSPEKELPMSDTTETLQVEVVDFPALRVARLDHQGPPHQLGETLRRFIQWRREHRLPPDRSRTFNLVFDDPDTVTPSEYRFSLCAEIRGGVSDNATGIYADAIPAGRCARIRHRGPDTLLEGRVRYLYHEWLPASGEELRNFPLFFERVSFFPDVPQDEAVTDIYLPLV